MGPGSDSPQRGLYRGLSPPQAVDDEFAQTRGSPRYFPPSPERFLAGGVMRKLALAIIEVYQAAISPYWEGYCRHVPTCSAYGHEAISKHGALRGVWLAARRLGRCRPLGTSGYDPVP